MSNHTHENHVEKTSNPDEIYGNCQLTAITEIAELCQLRDLYCTEWPRHCIGYYCLDNFIRWLREQPDIQNLHIFTWNGDWRSEGLYLIVDRYQLFVYSLNLVDNSKLSKAISLLDCSIGYKVSSVRQYHHEAVVNAIEAKNLKLDYNNETLMYLLPCEKALAMEVNCPAGYFLRPLEQHNAKSIDDLWFNRHKGSLFLIRRLIAWNTNMGIYRADNNELVAWCLRLQGGFLGALQVKDGYKRLGLGRIVAAATSRCIAQMGHDVISLVYPSNIASRNLFMGLGFSEVEKCYWLKLYPTLPDYVWPDNM